LTEAPARNVGQRALERLRNDPALFACEALGVELWSKQVEILTAVRDARLVAVRSGQGVGKTFAMAVLAL